MEISDQPVISSPNQSPNQPNFAPPGFAETVRVFARIGCLSFGGPAGQIALMHRELVEERGWIDEDHYLHALNFCHLLPGPEAQQLATYVGWRLHGVKGGLAAGLLFVIPGALVMFVLALFYAYAANLDWFSALFLGIKAAVLAIVTQALFRIAGRALKTGFARGLAAAAFIGLAFFALPFPLIIIVAGGIGALVALKRPEWLALKVAASSAVADGGSGHDDPKRDERGKMRIIATIKTILIWLIIWAAPMVLILVTLGQGHILWHIGTFFSKLAVVSFGGAYAVLAYMAQAAVEQQGWLAAGEMADGLGLAETTPGPLILVTQFVGTLTGFRAPEPFSPLFGGIVAGLLTLWVTFAPCFLWIFAFAPWIDRMRHIAWLKGALAAITAAIVGVIANLSLWFTLHVLFARVERVTAGPVRMDIPDWSSFDMRAGALAALALWLIWARHWPIARLLALMAALGLALHFASDFVEISFSGIYFSGI